MIFLSYPKNIFLKFQVKCFGVMILCQIYQISVLTSIRLLKLKPTVFTIDKVLNILIIKSHEPIHCLEVKKYCKMAATILSLINGQVLMCLCLLT